jgi:heterodisulfide reductase subunit B
VRYGYDPGCFRPTGGGPGDETVPAVARALGLLLEEVEDPGERAAGTLAMSGIAAYTSVGRLLARTARRLRSREDAAAPALVSPCGDCFRTLSRATRSLRDHPDLREKVAEELAAEGLALAPDSVAVRHLLDVLHEDVGLPAIRARVTRPLRGLRVAAYTGCLAQASEEGAASGAGGPTGRLGALLEALGAEVVEFPLGEHCCGGRAADASPEVATSLQHRILRCAADRRVDALAVACPRCRRNLETGQEPANLRYGSTLAVPVRHFADLLADALGLGVRS